MNEYELNIKVNQKLQEFEAFTDMHPSPDWEQSLMGRLDIAKSKTNSLFSAGKFAAAILLFIIINIGFIINMLTDNSVKTSNKDNEFKVISKELLINETSIRD